MTLETVENKIIVHEEDYNFFRNFLNNIRKNSDDDLKKTLSTLSGGYRSNKNESSALQFLLFLIREECERRGLVDKKECKID